MNGDAADKSKGGDDRPTEKPGSGMPAVKLAEASRSSPNPLISAAISWAIALRPAAWVFTLGGW